MAYVPPHHCTKRLRPEDHARDRQEADAPRTHAFGLRFRWPGNAPSAPTSITASRPPPVEQIDGRPHPLSGRTAHSSDSMQRSVSGAAACSGYPRSLSEPSWSASAGSAAGSMAGSAPSGTGCTGSVAMRSAALVEPEALVARLASLLGRCRRSRRSPCPLLALHGGERASMRTFAPLALSDRSAAPRSGDRDVAPARRISGSSGRSPARRAGRLTRSP